MAMDGYQDGKGYPPYSDLQAGAEPVSPEEAPLERAPAAGPQGHATAEMWFGGDEEAPPSYSDEPAFRADECTVPVFYAVQGEHSRIEPGTDALVLPGFAPQGEDYALAPDVAPHASVISRRELLSSIYASQGWIDDPAFHRLADWLAQSHADWIQYQLEPPAIAGHGTATLPSGPAFYPGSLQDAAPEAAYASAVAPALDDEPMLELSSEDLHEEPVERFHPLRGELLVPQAGITYEQVAAALDSQAVEGGRIGEILIRSRVVTEEQVLQALCTQLGVTYGESLQPDEVDVDLLKDLAIGYVKAQRCLPIRRTDDGVLMAIGDPLNVTAQDDVRTLLGVEVELLVVTPARIVEVINTVYTRRGDAVELGDGDEFSEGDAEELIDIIDLDDEAPIIRWVNSLMFNAAKERASDIHIEPGEKDVVVRNRIDGVLYETKHAHKQYLPSIVARVKIMAGLNIAEKRLPQDGRIRRKIAGRDIDMRVATIPTARGERVTIRLLDRTAVLLDMADIGMGPDHLEQMAELIVRPHGILMVTGPTGSGKTTTLYSALSKINTPDKNILTVEDPVEYQLDGVSQVQVNPKIDLTFAAGLRSFLRHDPDVIMVGEIRDLETAEIAIQASLTGHLVFSTVHTNDAAGAITRLVDMGVEPFLVASSLSGLLAQRLVRRLCPECREAYEPNYEEIRNLGLEPEAFFAGAIPPHPTTERDGPAPPPGQAFRAKGCPSCLGTGYSGRMGIYELLMLDDSIRALALKNTDAVTIKRAAINQGMRTLRDDGARKVVAGMTSIAEVMRVTQEDVA